MSDDIPDEQAKRIAKLEDEASRLRQELSRVALQRNSWRRIAKLRNIEMTFRYHTYVSSSEEEKP